MEIVYQLARIYPRAKIALEFDNPFELLIATILSAQSTDVRVNLVSRDLFRQYPGARELASADIGRLEQTIRSTGYYRAKAKAIVSVSHTLLDRHAGEVPRTMQELVALPGVGRKTANVVLGSAFKVSEGVVVDTHVTRLSQRLGLTTHDDAVRVEQDLMTLIPRTEWIRFAHRMILHGRTICVAKKPKCSECQLNELCPSAREPLE